MPLIFFGAWLVYGVFQIIAALNGIELWFGWPSWGAVLAITFCFMFRLPILLVPVTYYGARYAWDFSWWGALLFAAPGIAFGMAAFAINLVGSAFERFREAR